jgi:hypothetical protein
MSSSAVAVAKPLFVAVPVPESAPEAPTGQPKPDTVQTTVEKIQNVMVKVGYYTAALIPGISSILYLSLSAYNALRARSATSKLLHERYTNNALSSLFLSFPLVPYVVFAVQCLYSRDFYHYKTSS